MPKPPPKHKREKLVTHIHWGTGVLRRQQWAKTGSLHHRGVLKKGKRKCKKARLHGFRPWHASPWAMVHGESIFLGKV